MVSRNHEIAVMLNFLKSGLSTRQLDNILGHTSEKTNGWKSWEILKKYMLKDGDKNRLFLYSGRQATDIIRKIIEDPSRKDLIIQSSSPSNLEKYMNTHVIADSDESFYRIFSGETRNIIQSFFNPKKKLIGKCQFRGCKHEKMQLDTVHYSRERPKIFMDCAKKNRKAHDRNSYIYDVYGTMKCFLRAHSRKNSICFLCKAHHNELHQLEDGNRRDLISFKKNIETI